VSDFDTRIADLRARLAELRSEFARRPRVSPAAHERFAELSAELERLLAASPVANAARDSTPPPHASRIDELAGHFEAEHPDLAASLRQLMDLLGRAGI